MARQVLTYPDIPPVLTQAVADGRYEPLDSAYTKAESDAKYLTQALGDARYLQPATAAATYLPLTGGTLTGALRLNAGMNFAGDTTLTRTGAGSLNLDRLLRLSGAGEGSLVINSPAGNWTTLKFQKDAVDKFWWGLAPDSLSFVMWREPGTKNTAQWGSNGTLTLTPDVGSRAIDMSGDLWIGSASRAGQFLLRDWSNNLRWGLGQIAASPNNDFYLWDFPASKGRLHIGTTGTLTLEPDAGAPAIEYGRTGQVWQTDYRSIQLGMGGSLYAHMGYPQVGIAANIYYPSAGGTRYVANGYGATLLVGQDGCLYFDVAPNGTAGATATTSQRMKVDGASLIWNHAGGPSLICGAGAANQNVRVGSGAGNSRLEAYGTGLVPFADGFMFLGEGAYRWSTVYATSPTISTSHVSQKHGFARLDPTACVEAVLETDWLSFTYNDPAPPTPIPAPEDESEEAKAQREQMNANMQASYEATVEETAASRQQKGYVLGSEEYHTADLFGMADRYSASTHADLAVVACALQHCLLEIAELKARLV